MSDRTNINAAEIRYAAVSVGVTPYNKPANSAANLAILNDCRRAFVAMTQCAASGSKTIRSRVRVACAKRSNASVDGRTFPPSMRAM